MSEFIEFVSSLGEIVTSTVGRCWKALRNNLDAIGVLIILVSPLVHFVIANKLYGIIINILLILLGMILYKLDVKIHNKQYGIPVMRKKFVKYNKANDMVSIKKDDLNEVVNYMADLQEYFENEGMLWKSINSIKKLLILDF